MPGSLSDYGAAFPDLPREEVLSLFREGEMEREDLLTQCREIRTEIIKGQNHDTKKPVEMISDKYRIRKKSCLSPIIEQKVPKDNILEENRWKDFLRFFISHIFLTD